jgi:AcrR family transcriptional regulator
MTATAPRMAAADRRRHLIETAIRLFTEGSYHGTTTAEIARAAGVSEPILYRHFASKRDLYLAALEDVRGVGAEAGGDPGRMRSDRGDR